MLVTELEMVTEVRLLHLRKAASSILVTELGMVTEVRRLQAQKTPDPIHVTLESITTVLILLRNLYQGTLL